MGYHTDFSGEFEIGPEPLSSDQIAYIQAFNGSRRVARDVTKLGPDPVREAVGLPVGFEGAFYVGSADDGNFGQSDDGSVIDGNRAPGSGGHGFVPDPDNPGKEKFEYFPPTGGKETQPGLWCQWTTFDGHQIQWDEGEKFYEYEEWLRYIVRHFLSPWGKTLNGIVNWYGEEPGDVGAIECIAQDPDAAGNPTRTYIAILEPGEMRRVTATVI